MTEQEFAYLSDRIRGKLTSLARRFNRAAGLEEEAEDIVQDSLLTLWQLAEKGYPVRDAEALAVKITKTRCVERYRRQHIRFGNKVEGVVTVSCLPQSNLLASIGLKSGTLTKGENLEVEINGKLYQIIVAKLGEPQKYTLSEMYTGTAYGNELYPEIRKHFADMFSKILCCLDEIKNPDHKVIKIMYDELKEGMKNG